MSSMCLVEAVRLLSDIIMALSEKRDELMWGRLSSTAAGKDEEGALKMREVPDISSEGSSPLGTLWMATLR